MNLGFFTMPLHRPEKPWGRALAEDREAVLLAERLGFSEVWIGEHFSTKAEQIPAPLVFLATLIEQTSTIRLGTGVVNLPHHHPVVVAAEAALFDQLSGGRLMLGVGPGGLMSDAELFGREDMGERYAVAMESLDVILRLWSQNAPFAFEGEHWRLALERQVWPQAGVGAFPKPLQTPHPPVAMAMVGPGGRTAELIAERDFIPISSNFVPVENVEAQWQAYAEARERMGARPDPSVWRVCRNILVTESDDEADDILADPDGVFAFYFRYLRGVRRIEDFRDRQDAPAEELNELLGVDEALADCVIAGSPRRVLDRLVALVDRLGPFGTLVMVGHDWDETTLWQDAMRRLATELMPTLSLPHGGARRRRSAVDDRPSGCSPSRPRPSRR